MTALQLAVRCVLDDLATQRLALVGGLAVSARAEPRFTRDVDLAVAVASDDEAERIVSGLVTRGYRIAAQVEQDATGRLAVRTVPPAGSEGVDGIARLVGAQVPEEEGPSLFQRVRWSWCLKKALRTVGFTARSARRCAGSIGASHDALTQPDWPA